MRRLKLILLIHCMIISLTACSGDVNSSTQSFDSMGSIDAYSDGTGNVNNTTTSGKYDSLETDAQSFDMAGISNNINEIVDELKQPIENNDNQTKDLVESEVSGTTEEQKKIYDDKLVYRCNLELETLDYNESYSKIISLIEKYDCILQSETYRDASKSYISGYYSYYNSGYTQGKEISIIIRVPSEYYFDFVNSFGDIGNMLCKNQTVDNITQEYSDVSLQIKGLQAQLNRLEQMLAETDDINAMIQINNSITEVQYTLNKMTTRLYTMDMDIAYSYVTIDLKEVLEYTEIDTEVKTNRFIDRLKNQIINTWEGFLQFLEDLLFALIELIPVIFILGIIYLVVKITCKEKMKIWREKRKNRKEISNDLDALLSYSETEINNSKEVNTDEK